MSKQKQIVFFYYECKIVASSPISSWQIEGEKVETVTDFNFGGSKTTADGHCSRETKRHSLEGKLRQT